MRCIIRLNCFFHSDLSQNARRQKALTLSRLVITPAAIHRRASCLFSNRLCGLIGPLYSAEPSLTRRREDDAGKVRTLANEKSRQKNRQRSGKVSGLVNS